MSEGFHFELRNDFSLGLQVEKKDIHMTRRNKLIQQTPDDLNVYSALE